MFIYDCVNAAHAIVVLASVICSLTIPAARNYRSLILRRLGQCGVEAFALFPHIWKAADGRGLLTSGMFPVVDSLPDTIGWSMGLDCILLGLVFVSVSWYTSRATAQIAEKLCGVVAGSVRSPLELSIGDDGHDILELGKL